MVCLFFPQRVDKTLDVAAEDSSQAADEAVPADTAEEGKPSPKTQPLSYVLKFSLSLYQAIYHYYVSHIVLVGIIVVVIGETTNPPTYLWVMKT